MLQSLGILFLVAMTMAQIFKIIRMPRILGMLLCGIVIGPYVLDLLDPTLLNISAELRQIALIIILIKAGLTLNLADLKQVGRPAVLMSFVPACFEIVAYFIFAPIIFGISQTDALLMGSVLAAVSPAIVVPRMIFLIEEKYGTKKSIPQLILASASCDDVFVLVLFSTFTLMATGQGFALSSLINAPIAILLGVLFGAVLGAVLSLFFEHSHSAGNTVNNSLKVIIILSTSFIVISLEQILAIPFSGLLAVVSMAAVYKAKASVNISNRLAEKFGKLWIAAEILLFALVGASVDISYLLKSSVSAIIMIILGLLFRSVGVLLSLLGTKLSVKERAFCLFAYLPKATVQAAIGAVPLSLGLQAGSIILSVAVFSIILTAPLGAIAVDISYEKLLEKEI